MKIELSASKIKEVFEIAERFAGDTNIDVYYNYAYIEIKGKGKENKITTSNGDNSFSSPIEFKGISGEGEESILLPIGHFIKLIKDLPHDDFILDIDKNSISMKGKNFKYKLPVKIDKEFTFFEPKGEIINSITLKARELGKAIEKVIFCSGKDVKELKDMFLKTIYFNFNNDVMDIIATDRHRMAYKTIEVIKFDKKNDKTNILMPLNFIQNILPVLKGHDGNIEIKIFENIIQIIFDNGYNLFSRRVEIESPTDFKTLISFDMNDIEINVNKKELSGSLKRIAGLSENRIVGLKFEKSKLIIHGRGADLGEGEEMIDIINSKDITKDMIIIANFIIDTLSQIETDEITIRLNESNVKPIAIKEFNGDDNYIVSLMPTRS
jgi:DNA polymerase III sliding clamp (beta) subunit (PCNA family)